MVGGFYTEDGPHWLSSFMDLWWVGICAQVCSPLRNLLQNSSSKCADMEFFLLTKAVYKRFDWAGCVRGTKVNHLTKGQGFQRTIREARASASSALWHGVSVLGFRISMGISMSSETSSNSLSSSVETEISHTSGWKNTSIFLCTVRGLKSVLTLAAEVQGVLLKGAQIADCWVVLCIGLHQWTPSFSWLHQKNHFFCLGDGVRIRFFFGFFWKRRRTCDSHFTRLELREPIGKMRPFHPQKMRMRWRLWHDTRWFKETDMKTNHQKFNDCFLVKEEKQHRSTAHVFFFARYLTYNLCTSSIELLGKPSFEWLDCQKLVMKG